MQTLLLRAMARSGRGLPSGEFVAAAEAAGGDDGASKGAGRLLNDPFHAFWEGVWRAPPRSQGGDADDAGKTARAVIEDLEVKPNPHRRPSIGRSVGRPASDAHVCASRGEGEGDGSEWESRWS